MVKFGNLLCAIIAALVLFVGATTATAQLTWDPAGDGSLSGGSGNWNTGTWYNSTTFADVLWTNSNDAVLQGTGGTVSLTAPVLVNNLTFSVDGYTIAGNSTLSLNSAAANIIDPGVNFYFGPTILNNGNTTISVPITTNNGTELNIAGNGTLNLTAASTLAGGTRFYLYSGNLVISGTGSLTQNGSWNDIGSGSNSQVSMTLRDSGKFLTDGDFNLGDSPNQITNNTITLTAQDNATLKTGNFFAGKFNSNTAIVNVSGNATVTVNGLFDLADADGGLRTPTSGTLTQSGGKMTVGGEFWVGNGGGGNGVYNISAGMLTTGNWTVVGRNGATGVLTQTGGTISHQGGGNVIIGSLGGSGTWSVNGGAVLNNTGLALGENSNSGTMYLNAGLVQASFVQTWGGATGNLYFNGGTLQISGNGGYIGARDAGGVLNTYIQQGGAIIDTNGNSIVANNPLSPDPNLPAGVTDGGLTKNGLGTLALNGTSSTAINAGPSSYLGPTVVNAGTLLITGSLTTTSGIQVKSGATLGGDGPVSAVVLDSGATLAPGYNYTNSTQVGVFQPASLSSTGGILAFKLSNSAANGNDQIQVAGNLSLTNVTLNVSKLLNSALASGTYQLITSGSTTNLSGLTLSGLPASRQTYSIDLNTPDTVALDVSAAVAANLVWTGSISNVWDVTTTKNWFNTGTSTADVFFSLDNVSFNDTGKASNIVSIAANVQPQSVTFNLASSSAYTLQGPAGITGTTGLVVNGAGTVTVSNSNSYTGVTDIHGGAVVVNAGGIVGDQTFVSATNIAPTNGDTATATVSGGMLLGNTLSVGAAGSGILNLTGGQVTAVQAALGGSGGIGDLNMSGNGSLTVTGNNNPSFIVGANGGSGVMTLSGSASYQNSHAGGNPVFVVGYNGGSGTLNQSGNSSINTAAGEFWIGQGAGAVGTYNMSGGSLKTGNWFVIGRQGASGSVDISGNSAVTVTNGALAVGDGGPGTLVQSGNSVINVTTDNMYIGNNGGANGLYTLQSGTLNTGDIRTGVRGSGELDISGGVANARGWFRVGEFAGSTGTVNMTGGALNIGRNADGSNNNGMRLNVGEGGTGTMNVTGGQVTVNGPVMIGGQSWDGQASGNGYLGVSGSSLLTVTTGDWFMVGFHGGTGTMEISGGTVNTGGEFHIGDGDGQIGSNGTVNQSGNSYVRVGNYTSPGNGGANVLLGMNSQGTGIGVYNLSSGTLSGWDIRAGVDSTGTFTQTGGVVNVNGWLRLGELTGSTGVYNLSAGTVNANLMARIGEEGSGTMNISGNAVLHVAQDTTMGWPNDNTGAAGGSGIINLSNSGVVTIAGNLNIGANGGTGLVNIGDSANLSLTGGGVLDIGDDFGTSFVTGGTLNQTGGVISLATGQFWVGQDPNGRGEYNMAGGVLNVNNWLVAGRAGGTGVVTMTGGTINKQGGGNIIVGSLGGSGTWSMNGGIVYNNSNLVLGENSNTGTFYLNGGTMQANAITTYNAGTGYLYFNGGVLQASGGNGNFISTTSAGVAPGFTYIQTGGAIIDSNGFNLAIAAGLAPDPTLTDMDGGLTKLGSGVLALTGSNTYAGPTVVKGGTLLVSVNPLTTTSGIEVKSGATLGGDTSVSAVTLDAGATLAPGYTFTNPSQIGVFQPASLSSTGGILSMKITPAGNDQIQVAGNLSLTNVTLNMTNLLNAPIPAGTYQLITSGSTTNLGLTLTGLPVSRQTYTLDYNTPNAVDLDVTAEVAANLVWTGSLSNTWDVATTKNWLNTGTQLADTFFGYDNVAFNDTGRANNTVSIPNDVVPGTVSLNLSSSTAYTFTGTHGIMGTTGLVMSGAGLLTVSNPNAYTGQTDIHGGTVVITAGGALGDATLNSLTSIAPVLGDTATVTVSGGTLSGNALGIGEVGSGTLNISGGQVNVGGGGVALGGGGGAGYLNMSGAGSLKVTGTNNPLFVVGANGGTGVMTLGDSATVAISATSGDPVFVIGNNSSGTLTQSGNSSINTASGEFWVGQGGTGAGLFNMSGGVVKTGNWFVVGRGGATGAANISGNSAITVTNGALSVGDGGVGSLVQSGNSVINVTTDNTYLGNNGGATGAYALQSGTLNTGDVRVGVSGTGTFDVTGGLANLRWWFRIGQNAGSSGTASISGGTVNIGRNPDGSTNSGMLINVGEAGAGTLNMSGGLLTSTGHIDIGDPGTGTLTQTGGTILDGNEFWVSNNSTGNGTYTMSGGQLVTQSWIAVGRVGGTGIVNMTGGTINKQGGGNIIVDSLGGNGTWNMDGGLVLNNSNLVLGENTNTGSFHLNGGTVQATAVTTYINAAPNNTALGYLYFNGGVLQVSNANGNNFGNFLTNSGGDFVQAGGAIIDTNGNDITINAQLAHDPALATTDGGLTKQGAGRLTLNAANTYTGGTKINAGVLQLGSNGAMPSTSLTFGSNNGNTATLDLNGFSATVAALNGGSNAVVDNVAGAGPSTLVVGNNNANGTFGGTIRNTTSTVTLEKIGTGTLVLSGTGTYTGGTIVTAGVLDLTAASAIADGTSLTVGANATSVFHTAAPVTAASPAVSAVPEPGTIGLLVAAACCALGAWVRRRKLFGSCSER